MREIKFRAWSKNLKKFVCWYQQGLLMVGDTGELYLSGHMNVTDRFVLQQFTGLTDKNGKEIYEGDVVLYSNMKGYHTKFERKFVIEFGEQDFGCYSYQQTIGWNATPIKSYGKASRTDSARLSDGILYLFGSHDVEVIGNIYENPQLLEVNDEQD